MTVRLRTGVVAVLLLLSTVPRIAAAGSTEPALAVAAATATVDEGVVTLTVTANFSYGDVVRLGYPLAVVVTDGTTVASLYVDGTATLATGGGAPQPRPDAGIVAIAPSYLTAVLPAAVTASRSVGVRLEASFGGHALRSNTVPVQW